MSALRVLHTDQNESPRPELVPLTDVIYVPSGDCAVKEPFVVLTVADKVLRVSPLIPSPFGWRPGKAYLMPRATFSNFIRRGQLRREKTLAFPEGDKVESRASLDSVLPTVSSENMPDQPGTKVKSVMKEHTIVLTKRNVEKSGNVAYSQNGVRASVYFNKNMFGEGASLPETIKITAETADDVASPFAQPVAGVSTSKQPTAEQLQKAEERAQKAQQRAAKEAERVAKLKAKVSPASAVAEQSAQA